MNSIPSEYLRHLPELFQAPSTRTGRSFLGEFLKIFEALLSGRGDATISGKRVVSLEEQVNRYLQYLDPALVPVDEPGGEVLSSEFLNYLASWVALTLDQNWDMAKKRIWLSRIVPLYKRRGTLAGIQAYLSVFVGNQVTVDEPPGGFVVAQTSTVGEDTFIAGGPAYYFRVRIAYAYGSAPFDISEWKNLRTGTQAVVDLEKPAHTYYSLDARTPGFIIASRSTIATDTLIWERSQPFP
jgi:phage tail-like protein